MLVRTIVLYREQYAKLKTECRAMDDMIGSGQIATSPRINEDGSPVEEYHGGEISGAEDSRSYRNGTYYQTLQGHQLLGMWCAFFFYALLRCNAFTGNGFINGAYQETSKAPYERQDEKAIQWRLNLHQIGS